MALGNRRLRIVDLTPQGHQPMLSSCGRYGLTFNGEIYNHAALAAELRAAGFQFRSRSDTEVLLAALMHWGEGALLRLRGMFAFAFWDEDQGRLLLGRDRLGIKPLYYAARGEQLAFASEIPAILASGVVTPAVNARALQSYLRLLWVPEPGTLLDGVRKVPPGSVLRWGWDGIGVSAYWDLPFGNECEEISETVAAAEVREAVQAAVRAQMVADVPVGAFLSGGLDSTAIVAAAGLDPRSTLRTFSIGFRPEDQREEGALDDPHYARLAASSLNLHHKSIIIEPNVAELLPMMVRHLEDPIADPSALNCYLICREARSECLVLLSGTGGDELFGGYRKYVATAEAERYQRLPQFVREALIAPIAERLPVRLGSVGLRGFRFAKKFVKHAHLAPFERFIGYSSYYDGDELEQLLGLDISSADVARLGVEALLEAWERRASDDIVNRMTYLDLKFYLPGLGLAVMDRASMAASVEVRVPLLDDDLVDLVARYPGRLKVRGSQTKRVFRKAMAGLVPRPILERPKAPFAAPIRTWLRRDLKGLIHELLSDGGLKDRGLVDPLFVTRLIREHDAGWADHSLRIWALLTLELWLQAFMVPQPSGEVGAELTHSSMTVPVAQGET